MNAPYGITDLDKILELAANVVSTIDEASSLPTFEEMNMDFNSSIDIDKEENNDSDIIFDEDYNKQIDLDSEENKLNQDKRSNLISIKNSFQNYETIEEEDEEGENLDSFDYSKAEEEVKESTPLIQKRGSFSISTSMLSTDKTMGKAESADKIENESIPRPLSMKEQLQHRLSLRSNSHMLTQQLSNSSIPGLSNYELSQSVSQSSKTITKTRSKSILYAPAQEKSFRPAFFKQTWILFEIFPYLPGRDLLAFGCTNKTYYKYVADVQNLNFNCNGFGFMTTKKSNSPSRRDSTRLTSISIDKNSKREKRKNNGKFLKYK